MEILFVCTGNTCRSVMAEAIFNSINTLPHFHSSSAGIFAIDGSKASKNASEVVKNFLGIDIKERNAVQISKDMLEKNDLILTMTDDIKNMLLCGFSDYKGKIHSLNEYTNINDGISDPYGGDKAVYEKTFSQIKNSILDLISELKEGRGIY